MSKEIEHKVDRSGWPSGPHDRDEQASRAARRGGVPMTCPLCLATANVVRLSCELARYLHHRTLSGLAIGHDWPSAPRIPSCSR